MCYVIRIILASPPQKNTDFMFKNLTSSPSIVNRHEPTVTCVHPYNLLHLFQCFATVWLFVFPSYFDVT